MDEIIGLHYDLQPEHLNSSDERRHPHSPAKCGDLKRGGGGSEQKTWIGYSIVVVPANRFEVLREKRTQIPCLNQLKGIFG